MSEKGKGFGPCVCCGETSCIQGQSGNAVCLRCCEFLVDHPTDMSVDRDPDKKCGFHKREQG